MKLKSPAFEPDGIIPEKLSRYGDDRTPPLEFSDVPPEARSLTLIVDDPDAPNGLFTHWIAFNIDPNVSRFVENDVPKDVRFGMNDWGENGYGGPRPPSGEHRYFFHLYALDCRLGLSNGASREAVERAMEGHLLAEAEMMGRYAAPVA